MALGIPFFLGLLASVSLAPAAVAAGPAASMDSSGKAFAPGLPAGSFVLNDMWSVREETNLSAEVFGSEAAVDGKAATKPPMMRKVSEELSLSSLGFWVNDAWQKVKQCAPGAVPALNNGTSVGGGVEDTEGATGVQVELGPAVQLLALLLGEPLLGAQALHWAEPVILEAALFVVCFGTIRLLTGRAARGHPEGGAAKGGDPCGGGGASPTSPGSTRKARVTSATSPEATWQAFRRAAAAGQALSLEELRAAAGALAAQVGSAEASDSVSLSIAELVDHIVDHVKVVARPHLLPSLADSMSRAGQPDLAEDFATAYRAEARLREAAPIDEAALCESLVAGYAAKGNEKKVDELLAAERTREGDREVLARQTAAAIRGFVKCGKLGTATVRLVAMHEEGLTMPKRMVMELLRASKSPQALDLLVNRNVPLPSEALALAFGVCEQRDDVDTAMRLEKQARGLSTPLRHGAFEALLKLDSRRSGQRVGALLAEMQQVGICASEGLCGCLLANCAESQNIQCAEAVAAYLRNKSLMTLASYKTLMKVYACSGLFDKACDLYTEVQEAGIEPDSVMYGCLVKFAVKCGRRELSEELFEKVGGGFVQNYMWLIRSAARDGEPSKALQLLRRLKASNPEAVDVMLYNCVLDALALNGEVEQAEALFAEVCQAGLGNLVTYNTLMKGYCAKGDIGAAKRVLLAMEAAELFPDSATYNCLLSAAASSGDFRDIWHFFREMEHRQITPDQYTLSIMMKAARRAKDPADAAKALAVLDRASGIEVCADEVLLNTVLDACIFRKDFKRLAWALAAYDSSSTRLQPTVRTYGLLIKSCSVLHKTSRCWDFWYEMTESRGIAPNDITLSCMLDALIEGRTMERALDIFRKWKDRVVCNTVIYSTLIKGFASIGDPKRAMEAYRDMQEQGIAVNMVVYTSLIDAQARQGNMQEAAALLRRMEQDNCKPNTITYSNLIKGYCNKADLVEAEKIFNEMLSRGVRADTVVFNTLLDGCVRASDFPRADRLLLKMKSLGVEHSNYTLSILCKMWGKRGRLDQAFQAVRQSPSSKDSLVGSCLVTACLHSRAPDMALKAFREMQSWPSAATPDARVYSSLIAGLARLGRPAEAAVVASEAAEARLKEPLDAAALKQLFKALDSKRLMQETGVHLAARLHAAGMPVPQQWLPGAAAYETCNAVLNALKP